MSQGIMEVVVVVVTVVVVVVVVVHRCGFEGGKEEDTLTGVSEPLALRQEGGGREGGPTIDE